MGWFNKKKKENIEKLNPGQPIIADDEGAQSSRENVFNYRKQYENLEIVNTAINYIVNDAANIPSSVGEQIQNIVPIRKGVRARTLVKILNHEPNPFEDINSFKRKLIIDLIIDGNIFLYFDGSHLYHLPATKTIVVPDSNTYVSHYEFDGRINYYPDEIIHVKENSFYSIYRGVSRLKAAERSMKLLTSLRDFQDNFFKNGAVPGLVIKSPNTLSEKIKERLVASWMLNYRPSSGGRRPLVLDGGLELDSLSNINFKELDFQNSIDSSEKTIMKALGIPPVLLDGGNNANIRPNHRLFYLETVVPIARKINSALSRYFGYYIEEDLTSTTALQPELNEIASYHSSLVNGGVITPNEARAKLGYDKIEGLDEIRVPANIAGSAVDPNEGGRPPEEDN